MPYFTRQVAPNGSLLLVAHVGPSQAKIHALRAAGQPIPTSMQVQALVDTGASCTCVDPSVLASLGLTPTGSATVNTPSTGLQPVSADQFDISLTIITAPNMVPLVYSTIPVVQSELLVVQGFHMLLGRDVLRSCLLTFDGQNGLFSLAY